MTPPRVTSILDQHGGFTAETTPGNTLWRPGSVLKRDTLGVLQSHNERSFYQRNDNVTRAVYKVKGYRYPVICWFDNDTGARIA